MKHRSRYNKYNKAIPPSVLGTQTTTILSDYGRFFKEFPDVDTIPQAEFITWFKFVAHPKLSDDSHAIYEAMLNKVLSEEIPPEIESGLMDRVVAADAANKMDILIKEYAEGAEIHLPSAMQKIMDQLQADTKRKVKSVEVMTDIEEMMSEDESDSGLHWRLPCLNMSMRPLRGGDFGLIAGRPDKGKTSFLTSELTYMAQQVDKLYPGQNRSIIWFNNEGPGKRIKYRTYQSALNSTTQDLLKLQQAGELQSKYIEAMGGRADLIRVFDIHDWWNWEVEELLGTLKPALIVFDMIDNIKFGGGAANNGQRTDQLLEEMYKWGRNLSVKLDVPALATSQISAEGDGLSYPTLSMLKDSKTGKQGAAEFIITVGALNEITMQGSRFIGMTKNKLHREGGPRDPRCEVIFDGLRGRYNMPQGV